MPVTALSGQELVDLAIDRLGGYANMPSTSQLLSFLNEAKDEVWAVLKSLNTEYFAQPTQFTDASQVNYFGPMSTAVRQYTLPADFREINLFLVADPAYAQVKFTYKTLQDRDFQGAFKAANVDASLAPTAEYFYTILGKGTLLLAQYPEFSFAQPIIYYVRNLLDFETGDTIDEILLPYSKKIADYAVMRLMLTAQDQEQFEEYRKVWKDDLLMMASGAGPRNAADAIFVQDFNG